MTTLPYASRSTRLLGQIVDGMIAAAPFIVGATLSAFSIALGGILMMVGVCWWIFYHLLADGLPGGQSFAKKWLGMQVVSEKTGAPCTFGQSFIRNLLLAVLGPIDWVFIFGEKHQRLGDKAAGTIVLAD
jgi:uncharacterized RDD family membrane protein YckC